MVLATCVYALWFDTLLDAIVHHMVGPKGATMCFYIT